MTRGVIKLTGNVAFNTRYHILDSLIFQHFLFFIYQTFSSPVVAMKFDPRNNQRIYNSLFDGTFGTTDLSGTTVSTIKHPLMVVKVILHIFHNMDLQLMHIKLCKYSNFIHTSHCSMFILFAFCIFD